MAKKGNQDREKDVDFIWMKSGDKPIKLNVKGSKTYYRTNHYQRELLNAPYTWHSIDVHHLRKYNKDEILQALFHLVGYSEFYPVGYREGKLHDSFVVRNCKAALQKLFATRLSLPMGNRQYVDMSVSLMAAEYSTGQIFPTKVLEKIVNRQFSRLETTDQISKVLNLEQISTHPEMADIVIYLGNQHALELLCKVIAQDHKILNTINGLNLSKNGIVDPSPMKEFVHSSIKMIDLRHNNIQNATQFTLLKCLAIDELFVMGNPCTTQPDYLDAIKKLLPTLKRLDGISTEKIKETSADTIEMMYPGEEILDSRDRVAFSMYRNSDMWAQVVIEHRGQCSKREILKAIFDIVDGEFYPCYYKSSRIEDTFFVRKSYHQLEQLLDVGLALRIPNCEEIPMKLRVNVSDFNKGHVDPQEALIAAMSTRFNVMDKCLNLTSLHTSPELKNVLILLSNPHTFATVMTMASRRFLTNLEHIRLSKNGISTVKPLRTLNNAKGLKILDVSHNLIESLEEFENVIKVPITELTLDGNPLCKKFSSGSAYMNQVKKLFPELTKLDGVAITKQSLNLPFEKNYLCSLEAYGFVEQFVTSYFPVFDSRQRPTLIEMYHKNAMVSLTFQSEAFRYNPYIQSRIEKYQMLNRNLLAGNPKMRANIFYRKDSIIDFFECFPETEHDLYSFTTDVSVFNEHLVCLTISGVFQEPAGVVDSELKLAFTRTLIFQQYANELGIFKNTTDYKITNETVFITNPTSEQTRKSFCYKKPNKPQSTELTNEDKENFAIMFQRMTGMKNVWCTRVFEEANWDFKRALEVFVKMDRENRIPDTAFNEI